MKIRQGFVSNSSSSSFCIYGVQVGLNDMATALDIDIPEENREYSDSWERMSWEDMNTLDSLVNKELRKLKVGLATYIEVENPDYSYIGFPLDGVKLTKANMQKLEEAEKVLKNLFGKDATFQGGEIST